MFHKNLDSSKALYSPIRYGTCCTLWARREDFFFLSRVVKSVIFVLYMILYSCSD